LGQTVATNIFNKSTAHSAEPQELLREDADQHLALDSWGLADLAG
jgi:hypothetical protein